MVHTVTEIIMTAAADRPLSGLDLHPRVISALKKGAASIRMPCTWLAHETSPSSPYLVKIHALLWSG